MVIFPLRKRPEYHLVTRLRLVLRTGGVIGAWLFEHVDRDELTHGLYTFALPSPSLFAPPSIGGMSHPQRREVAWCFCLHGLFTWSRVNAHFPRRFAETSRCDSPRTVWRQSVQRFASSVKVFAWIFFGKVFLSACDFVVCEVHAQEKFCWSKFLLFYLMLRLDTCISLLR